jgi:hypothetical protein
LKAKDIAIESSSGDAVQTIHAVVAQAEDAGQLVKSMQASANTPAAVTARIKSGNERHSLNVSPSELFLWFDQRTMAERAGINPDKVVLLDVIVEDNEQR